jgi:hypothetical protein
MGRRGGREGGRKGGQGCDAEVCAKEGGKKGDRKRQREGEGGFGKEDDSTDDDGKKEGKEEGKEEVRGAASALELHQGRVRSFPHVEGNYPGFVYIDFSAAAAAPRAADEAVAWSRRVLPGREVVRSKGGALHMSLSRSFAVRRKQIAPLLRSLKSNLGRVGGFDAVLSGSAAMYGNDEGSRTFCGLLVESQEGPGRLVTAVDESMVLHGLDTYYSPPSFHVSVAWSLGPCPKPPPVAKDLFASWGDQGGKVALRVGKVRAKIGARTYTIGLLGEA